MISDEKYAFFLLLVLILTSVTAASSPDDANNTSPTISANTNMHIQTIENKNQDKEVSADNDKIICTVEDEQPNYSSTPTAKEKHIFKNKLPVVMDNKTNTVKESAEKVIVTPETFSDYITNALLNDNISNGTTLDFSGKFDGERYAFTINKPVNIISSKNDAFFCFYSTQNLEETYGLPNHSFLVTKEGSGTNITGITFENTMIETNEAYNVIFDNLTVYCNTGYGWGLGSTSIRKSENVTIKNSYFNTIEDEIWASTVVFAASKNCLLENCTVTGSGFIGNLVYATTYNVEVTDRYGNSNITIRANKIIGRDITPNLQTCYSVCLIGDNLTVEDNYIENSNGYLIMSQYHDDVYSADGAFGKLIIRNNSLGPGKIGVEFNSCTISDNTFYGPVTLDVLNNTIQENNTEKDVNENPYTVEEESLSHPTIVNITAPTRYIYDETNVFTVTITDKKTGTPITEGYLEVYSDGKLFKNISVSNETTTFTYNNPIIGEHHVRVWYYPITDNVLKSQKVHNIQSEKIMGKLTLETENSPSIGENITLKVNYALNKDRNHTANITFTLPGQNPIIIEAVNHTATLETMITTDYIRDILGGREQSIKISATCNDTNIEITGINKKLGVQKAVTTTSITPESTMIEQTTTITATVTTLGNIPINKGTVTFTANGETIATVNVKNNTATTTTTFNTPGSETITAMYSGCVYFIESQQTKNLTVNRINTRLSINNQDTAKYDESILITGKLTDENNNVIKDEEVIISNNNVKTTVKTNNIGEYSYYLRTNTIGTNIITVNYQGNNKYNASSASNNYTVNKQDTIITLNTINSKDYDDDVIVNGTLRDAHGNVLKQGSIIVNINNKNSTIVSDNNGNFKYTTTAGTVGTNTAIVTYIGNNYYNSATIKTVFTVNKLNTIINVNPVTAKKYGDPVVITGTLKDIQGNPLKQTDIIINKILVKTDNNGKYAYTTTANTIGTNNITITFDATGIYSASTSQTRYNVRKLSSTISINATTTKYDEQVTIMGTLKDENNQPIKDMITLKVNTKNYNIITDKQGTYTQTITANIVGTNNITITYNGNAHTEACTSKTTFNVNRQDIKITLSPITTMVYTENTTITGILKDGNGKTITYSNIKLNINDKNVTVKTDNKGTFTYKYVANTVGTNNITIIYPGNTQYKYNMIKTTFKVEKLDLKLTIKKIKSVAYQENMTITGTFKDKNGKILGNSKVKININGKNKYVKTNNKGVYRYTTRATKTGNITVTVSHAGNKNYNPVTTKTSANIKKQDLKITVNATKKVGYGSKVYIKGKLTDKYGKVIKNTVITININGKIIRAKTNNKGIYNHSLTTSKLGTNNITVSYPGNKNYNKLSKKVTFTVTKQTVKITATVKQVKGTKKATITGTLKTKDGKTLRNSIVTLTINDKNKKAKTNNKGIFTLTTTAKKGTNTLIASYNTQIL